MWYEGLKILIGIADNRVCQGAPLVSGTASRNGKWTAEDDRLAQLIEVFGPFPEALLQRGVRSRDFFDGEGKQLVIRFSILHIASQPYIAWSLVL